MTLAFFAGIFTGVTIGIGLMCLMVMAGRCDRDDP